MVIAIVGAGGHAKCVYECIHMRGEKIIGFFDDDQMKLGQNIINGVRVLGISEDIAEYNGITGLFMAIGDNRLRLAKYHQYLNKGYKYPEAIHLKAYISEFSSIGRGNFIMGAVIINPGSTIGNYCIINTSATVGHDCILEDGVQIGPGVNIAGSCKIKKGAFIGIGAKIGPEVTIGAWAVVGAGSVVLRDMPDNTFSHGVPVKIIKKTD